MYRTCWTTCKQYNKVAKIQNSEQIITRKYENIVIVSNYFILALFKVPSNLGLKPDPKRLFRIRIRPKISSSFLTDPDPQSCSQLWPLDFLTTWILNIFVWNFFNSEFLAEHCCVQHPSQPGRSVLCGAGAPPQLPRLPHGVSPSGTRHSCALLALS